MPEEFVDSTSDDRTVNNVMRHEYRVLSEAEKAQMAMIKDLGVEFCETIALITTPTAGRCKAIATTKVEEAVMWAVKGLTE